MEEEFKDLFDNFDFSTFSEDEIEESKQMMKEHDVIILISKIKDKISNWKGQRIHCGIVGASGSGKSNFINAVRNLLPEDEGAAEVGVNETTMEPTPYQDPNNPNIYYWDLPGVGTPNFPKDETYFKKIGFERYDFVLIITAVRLTENDIWLAEQIRSARKNFYVVRTKLDQDLRNIKRNYPNTYNELRVRKRIKEATVKGLEKHAFKNPKVYLISNNDQQLYDFPRLKIELTNALLVNKRKAKTLAIHAFSKEIIHEKKKVLEKNISYLSGISALGAVVPVPGVSLTADIAIISNEIFNYRQQLGLGDDELIKYNLRKDKIDLIKKISSEEAIIKLFVSKSASFAKKEVARYVPIIGTVIASSASYYSTFSMLETLLNKMAEVSVELMEKRVDLIIEESENKSD